MKTKTTVHKNRWYINNMTWWDDVACWEDHTHSMTTAAVTNSATVMKDEMQVGLHELPVTTCVAWHQCWNSQAASDSWHTS